LIGPLLDLSTNASAETKEAIIVSYLQSFFSSSLLTIKVQLIWQLLADIIVVKTVCAFIFETLFKIL